MINFFIFLGSEDNLAVWAIPWSFGQGKSLGLIACDVVRDLLVSRGVFLEKHLDYLLADVT